MSDHLRFILGGSIIGLLAAGMLAMPSLLPPALADEEPTKTLLSTKDGLWPTRFDTDNLVKFDFTIEPSVSTDVVRTRTVRKIGYGKTAFVKIITTPSGVYSTDGVTSPHIRYPGIHKELKRSPWGRIALWSGGKGWMAFTAINASSFVSITPFKGGQLVTTEEGNCVFVENAAYC
ncbi:MAG: hypothetical protein ACYCZU_12155 [Devosia sp.]